LSGDRLSSSDATGEAELLSLDYEADKDGWSVADHVAMSDASVRRHDALLRRHDALLRRWVAQRIMKVFVTANIVTLVAFVALVALDQGDIQTKVFAPADRLVSSQVFMALLGATTVQVGTIAVIMARYLFPSRS
jgi:hypothetical protein